MSSFTKSGSLKQRAKHYDDDLTLKQVDNALGRWLKRVDRSRCPRCNDKIPKNFGLHCLLCHDMWMTEFGEHMEKEGPEAT